MLLGVIGDDFTGSSDIANTLAKCGMRVTQFNGIPETKPDKSVEAGVVALKSRTIDPKIAVEQSLEAAHWLLSQGCQQLFFKYCSTFDSTPSGNIGPVADALAELTGEDKVIFCPAFPATGRSIYKGYLFVGDVPLHESGMKDHPLTPMTDSNLMRWLGHQTKRPVGLLPYSTIGKGTSSIREFLASSDTGYLIADAIEDHNLIELGRALSDRGLVTGGSGLAMGLPENFGIKPDPDKVSGNWRGLTGKAVILSGSCSLATRGQVKQYQQHAPSRELSAREIVEGTTSVKSVCDWVCDQQVPPLVFTSADPQVVKSAQEEYGGEKVAEAIEGFFGGLAVRLLESGFERIVSAGGETSGAVVSALNVQSMEIGPEIAAGVPALRDADRNLVLALKSGNFGGVDFFKEALEVLAN